MTDETFTVNKNLPLGRIVHGSLVFAYLSGRV
jgi:hypothetical protein